MLVLEDDPQELDRREDYNIGAMYEWWPACPLCSDSRRSPRF